MLRIARSELVAEMLARVLKGGAGGEASELRAVEVVFGPLPSPVELLARRGRQALDHALLP